MNYNDCLKTKIKLLQDFDKKENPTELEKAILNLQCMELDIRPHSKAERWGYKKALRMAIKALQGQLPKEADKNV